MTTGNWLPPSGERPKQLYGAGQRARRRREPRILAVLSEQAKIDNLLRRQKVPREPETRKSKRYDNGISHYLCVCPNYRQQEEQFEERLSVRIVLPDTLRSLLVDDWENITKNMQVVALPAIAPVNKLLQMYVDDEKPKRTNAAELDVLEEVVAGLKEYFLQGIGRILLYAHERDQYRFYREKLAKGEPGFENLTWCDLYGAEHMARLLCMTPFLIPCVAYYNGSANEEPKRLQQSCPSSLPRPT
jgi:hypothetical protein